MVDLCEGLRLIDSTRPAFDAYCQASGAELRIWRVSVGLESPL